MGSLDDTDNHNESYPIPIPTSGDTVKSFPSQLNHVSPCTCAATGNNETNVWIKYFCYGKDVGKKPEKVWSFAKPGGWVVSESSKKQNLYFGVLKRVKNGLKIALLPRWSPFGDFGPHGDQN